MELQNSTVLVPAANGATSSFSVDRIAIELSPQTSPTTGETGQVGQPTCGRPEVVA